MRIRQGKTLVLATVLLGFTGINAQQPLPDAPQPQNNTPQSQQPLPEAPSTSKPPERSTSPLPSTGPASTTPLPEAQDQNTPPATPPPSSQVTTVPQGNAPDSGGSSREQLFTLSKNVNFVLVPATVKDADGRLVEGLLPKDFSIYEDGIKQEISFFTSDPFPLSAAVVIDSSLPDTTWSKVKETLSALVGAFSQFDEVSIYTYGNTVQKMQDFTGVNAERLAQSMRRLRAQSGRMGGVPVTGGPLTGSPSPTVNGRPLDPSTPQIRTMPKQSYVLNDAILEAAQNLAKRDTTRRRILFVISDGRELGSSNGYADVLKVLLTRQITLYAVGVGGGGIPGYRQLERIRIPGQGYGDILPKYASATGGQVYSEVNPRAIEEAYSRVTEEARNQYTIGYNTRATPSSTYRSVEVRVRRPDMKIFARDGYYPLPPGR